jgi:glycosyltransferase XagB
MARVSRGGVAFGVVLLMFVAFVVFGGRLLSAESHSSAPPSVPSVSDDGSPGSQPAPARPAESARPIGSSGGALPQADGVQAVSSADDHRAAPVPQAREDGASWPQFIIYGVLVVVSLLLFVVAATTLWWMLHAWRSPEALAATGFRCRNAGRPRSFSLLLPARHEQHVVGDTIDVLARLDHPAYEVIVIIGHDDPETERVARAAAARHRRVVRVVIDDNIGKNKPKALNTALPACRGEIVGVFDAEDDVHPALLRLVEARFEESGADVVEAGVQLMNVRSSWWSLRNCVEYYFWFRSRLHFHADQRFIPLGGNTGKRVDVLRVDTGSPTAKPAPPSAPAFGSQVATRLDVASDPDALAALQSRTVDQRVLATLAVLVATQPVVLEDVSAVGAEEVAGTPQREFTLGGPPAQLQGFFAVFER